MQTQTVIKCITAVFLSLLISACGGGSSSQLDDIPLDDSSRRSSSSRVSSAANSNSSTPTSSANSVSSTPTSSASSVSSIDSTSPRKIGNGSGEDFTEGVIEVGIGDDPLAYGGSTTLTVSVVSNTNALVTTPVVVTFDSDCVDAGDATFTDSDDDPVTSVTTTDGEASVTYNASTCTGEDIIQASASLSGAVRVAEAAINVAADTVQTISFVDANPTRISLKGTGGIETSTVRFRLIGGSGAPLRNSPVSMALNTTLGGLCLADPANSTCVTTVVGTTNDAGEVSVTVQAGSIPTPIRITATALNTNISTQSNELLVSTGIPDQDSMSISAEILNPECFEIDGVTSTITMRMADAFNNPPPAGTAISFRAEGGKIDSGCSTDENGECSVTWTCQSPRPTNGRVTILGFAQGNESFTDLDGNGYYDADVDGFTADQDFAEAFLDIDENGLRDPATESFIDFNQDQNFTDENGIYNGVLCETEGSTCTKSGITVRDSLVIVMSSRSMAINITQIAATATTRRFRLRLTDQFGNSAPNGTVVSISTTALTNATAALVGSTTVGNTTGYTDFELTLTRTTNPDNPSITTDDPSGSIAIIATTPEGYAYNTTLDI